VGFRKGRTIQIMSHSLFRYSGLFVVLLLCATGFAQDPAKIAGKVTDARGNPVPGATVRVTGTVDFQPIDTLSDVDGSFELELGPGTYQITVEMSGFQSTSRPDVNTASELSRRLVLPLGSLPRPPKPNIAKSVPRAQQQDPSQAEDKFQTAEITDLPGLSQFRQEPGTGETALSRADTLLLINGNSASLDAGSMADPAFRQMMMSGARSMGFQVQEFGNAGEGGRGPPPADWPGVREEDRAAARDLWRWAAEAAGVRISANPKFKVPFQRASATRP
jgi:hypothetical protein